MQVTNKLIQVKAISGIVLVGIFPLFIEVLPYLNVLTSDEGKLRLKGSYFTEDYSESQSVPENIVKIRNSGKDRLNRRTQHKRKMKKKIQRVS